MLKKAKKSRFLVFTAYLLEKHPVFDPEQTASAVPNWYPTVYFYDCINQKIVW